MQRDEGRRRQGGEVKCDIVSHIARVRASYRYTAKQCVRNISTRSHFNNLKFSAFFQLRCCGFLCHCVVVFDVNFCTRLDVHKNAVALSVGFLFCCVAAWYSTCYVGLFPAVENSPFTLRAPLFDNCMNYFNIFSSPFFPYFYLFTVLWLLFFCSSFFFLSLCTKYKLDGRTYVVVSSTP